MPHYEKSQAVYECESVHNPRTRVRNRVFL